MAERVSSGYGGKVQTRQYTYNGVGLNVYDPSWNAWGYENIDYIYIYNLLSTFLKVVDELNTWALLRKVEQRNVGILPNKISTYLIAW